MVVTPAHEIEDGALLHIGRRHCHMPALGRDGYRAASRWNQRAHAEPGARPYEPNGGIAYGRSEADVTTEGFNRKRPCMVCECDLVARYRRGNRQYGVSRPRRW